MTYNYRLIFPPGGYIDRQLPFIAMIGDILDIDQGVFRVYATANLAFNNETMLFLERW